MMPIQIVLDVFLLFALSRVFLRYRGRQIKLTEFIFWSLLFLTAVIGITWPEEMTHLANTLGIGRGADLVLYASVVTLFYLVFRIYVMMEDLRHDITKLVRKVSLKEPPK